MIVFVDTSALYALMDADDGNHARASRRFDLWLEDESVRFVTTNYILVETCSLVQSRLGLPAVRSFQEGLSDLLQINWVDEELHRGAVGSLLAANRRRLSLVDCTSFEVARRLGIETVFAFDRHFRDQGFQVFP